MFLIGELLLVVPTACMLFCCSLIVPVLSDTVDKTIELFIAVQFGLNTGYSENIASQI